MSVHYKSLAKRTMPEIVPLFPLSGAVLLPGCDLPLNIFEPRFLNLIDDALKGDRVIGLVQTREDGLCQTGSLGRITQFSETEDGRYVIVIRGLRRFKLVEQLPQSGPYMTARVSYDDYLSDPDYHLVSSVPEAFQDRRGEDRAALTLAMKSYAKSLGVSLNWDSLAEIPLPRLVDQTAMISPFKPEDKQSLLEAGDIEERRRLLIGLMHLYTTNPDGDNGARSSN